MAATNDYIRMDKLNFTRLKQKSRHLEVVNEYALKLLRTTELNEVLWLVVKTAIANIGFKDCIICLLESDGETLSQRAAHGPKNPAELDILNPITIKTGQGIVGQVAQHGTAEIVMDTRLDSRYIVDDETRLSEIAVPIICDDAVIGVIGSEHPDAGFYTEEHLEVMTTIASMAATKISNAVNNERFEQHTQQLQYDASHDPLTGLFNRREFEHHLRNCLNSLDPAVHTHVLCYSDVNGFKKLNDTYGHNAGDEYLCKVANMIKASIGSEHVCARMGDYEFCILFKNSSIKQARGICEQICNQIKGTRSRRVSDSEFAHLSMGLYSLEQTKLSTSDAMARADQACYFAKKSAVSTVCDYTEIGHFVAAEQAEMLLINWLRAAIESNDLKLAAQEIFPFNNSNQCRSFEILLRLGDNAPDTGSIEGVLNIAARHGLSTRVDHWVVTQVLGWMHSQRTFIEQQVDCIAINLSADSIENPSFQQFLIERVATTTLPAHKLCFEITESIGIVDIAQAAVFINRLRALGCLVALDDFGSGLTCYNYLRHFTVDILKIDGAFVKNATSNPIEAKMMASINDLGHSLNMHTIAEQVEDKATFQLVKAMGIDCVQGFYLSEPVGIEQLNA